MARSLVRRYAAASSLVSKPTITFVSICGGRRFSTASRTLGLNFAAQPAAFAVGVSGTCSAKLISPWNRLNDYNAGRLAGFVRKMRSAVWPGECAGYACAAAERIGMVIGLAASVAESMWQRPSKIAPGSMIRHGVWISPVTMALG